MLRKIRKWTEAAGIVDEIITYIDSGVSAVYSLDIHMK